MGMMLDRIGEPAMLEQLAEESTELAKAALKKARILWGENPTPKTLDEADYELDEEVTDVSLCLDELELTSNWITAVKKKKRFEERWEKKMKSEEEDTN